jgi:hypothetical protein
LIVDAAHNAVVSALDTWRSDVTSEYIVWIERKLPRHDVAGKQRLSIRNSRYFQHWWSTMS